MSNGKDSPTTYEVILLRDELKESRRELIQERQSECPGIKALYDICGRIKVLSEAIVVVEESLTKHNIETSLKLQEDDAGRFGVKDMSLNTAIRFAQHYRAEKNELAGMMHIKNNNIDKEQVKSMIRDLQSLYRRLNFLIHYSNMNTKIDLDILKYDYLRR